MLSLLDMNHRVCRCCLLENPKLTYNIYDNNLRRELCELAPSVHIEPNDGLPDVICELCLSRVRDALEFRQRCVEADRLLRQRNEQTWKALEAQNFILDDVLNSLTKEIENLDQHQEHREQEQPLEGEGESLVTTTSDINLFALPNVVHVDEDSELGQDIDTSEFNAYFPADYPMPDSVISVSTLESSTNLEALVDKTYGPQPYEISEVFTENYNSSPSGISTQWTTLSSGTTPETLRIFTPDGCASITNLSEPTITTITTSSAMLPPTTELPTVLSEPPTTNKRQTPSRVRSKSLHPCTHCEKKFTRNFQLKLHLISVHNVGDGLRYKCEVCLKTFASGHSLSYHIKSIHSEVRPFQCEHCGRSFVLRTQLVSHLRIHTGESKPRIYQCTKCEKSWPTRSDLRTHMRSHNPPLVRPFKCDLCEKSFYTRGHLSSHILVHTGEKPFACAYCEGTYQSVGNLNYHMVRQHADVIMSQTCYEGSYES